MNGLEEIRAKNRHRALDDREVQSILSRLEIAEAALEEIIDQCNDPIDMKIAENAIKLIRV